MSGKMFASTMDGVQLPVIDLTLPEFGFSVSEENLEKLKTAYLKQVMQKQPMTPEMTAALATSTLGGALQRSAGGYLPGLATYQIKLGPENWGHPIDRAIASSYPAVLARRRLVDMVELLATGVEPQLKNTPRMKLLLVSVASGTAIESWNVLLELKRRHPELLQGRSIVIAALDIDCDGPEFGRRAVDALKSEGGPLSELEVTHCIFSYDWAEARQLQRILEELGATECVTAISSEGGLFEYGTNGEIAMNLRVIAQSVGPEALIVGSVTRTTEEGRLPASGLFTTYPRSLSEFAAIANQAGWKIGENRARPFSYHLKLTRS